ncbi:MAG: transposase [Nitrospiraceae bacterium]|nr:MAG: transposase [Nitrospiraceae bacterium]
MIFNLSLHTRRAAQTDRRTLVQPGMYYITLCTQRRECLFGEIRQGKMKLNDAGAVVQKTWEELSSTCNSIWTDEFVIMPNHVHGIISVTAGAPPEPGGNGGARNTTPALITLPGIVYHFKSYTTARYRLGMALMNWPPLRGRLWMRNYHEGIISTEKELEAVRQFIRYNPLQWGRDRDNPANL